MTNATYIPDHAKSTRPLPATNLTVNHIRYNTAVDHSREPGYININTYSVVSNKHHMQKPAYCIDTDTLTYNHKVFNIINWLRDYSTSDKIHYVKLIESVILAYYQLSNIINRLRDRGVGEGEYRTLYGVFLTTVPNRCNFPTRLMVNG